MTRSKLFIALVGVGLVFSSCNKQRIKPSSEMSIENRNLTGFNEISVSSAIEVDITFSNTEESVVVEANSNIHSFIKTDIVAGRLIIRVQDNVRFKSHATIKVHVKMLDLQSLELSGASDAKFTNGLVTNYLNLDLSGASNFEGSMALTSCNVKLSGASNAEIVGSSNLADIRISGASNLGHYTFVLDTLKLNLSGASSASLTVNNTMDIEASGASTFNYMGTGTIGALNLSGASSVNKH